MCIVLTVNCDQWSSRSWWYRFFKLVKLTEWIHKPCLHAWSTLIGNLLKLKLHFSILPRMNTSTVWCNWDIRTAANCRTDVQHWIIKRNWVIPKFLDIGFCRIIKICCSICSCPHIQLQHTYLKMNITAQSVLHPLALSFVRPDFV